MLAYFYCSYTEEPRRSANAFLATVLKQLSIALNPSPDYDTTGLGLPPALVNAYKEQKQQGFSTTQLDLKEMENILCSEILAAPQVRRVVIVIDALDEMEESSRKQIFPVLRRLQEFCRADDGTAKGKSNCRVYIYITSREQRDIKIALRKDGWGRMALEQQDTGADIQKYIEAQIDTVIDSGELLEGDVDDALRDEIISKLAKSAGGM